MIQHSVNNELKNNNRMNDNEQELRENRSCQTTLISLFYAITSSLIKVTVLILSQFKTTAPVFHCCDSLRASTFRLLTPQPWFLLSRDLCLPPSLTRHFPGCTVPSLHCNIPCKPECLNRSMCVLCFLAKRYEKL